MEATGTIRRSLALLTSAALAFGTVLVGSAPVAFAGTPVVTYPGTCATASLQDCIDASAPGLTIRLRQDVIDEYVFIDRSLTLEPAAGFDPVLAGIAIADGMLDPSVGVTIRDIRISSGIDATFSAGSGHSVTIERVEVGKDSPSASGISLSTSVLASLTVERSYIRTVVYQGNNITFVTDHTTGTARFRAVGNVITQHGGDDSSSGIEVSLDGTGTTRADILNNSIWDVARANAGGASGLFIYPSDTTRSDINIVGNTVDTVFTGGMELRNNVQSPGTVSMDLFDNIFSHAGLRSGIELDSENPATFTFRGGYNDSFANVGPDQYQGNPKGPGSVNVNPRFVDRANGNLRLKQSSPLIAEGLTCSPGGVANLDAAGRGRLRGASVDIGAFERGAGAPTGVAKVGTGSANQLTGTNGDDILCGFGGDDDLSGRGGEDYIDDGPGRDLLFGQAGDDTLCANDGAGRDRLVGGPGTDGYRADPGDDLASVERRASCRP
ncbi:MAG TPA: hypothetical protein VI341_10740 [Actinomycetota bacterium]